MKILLNAPFDRYSGYGNDGIDIALALTRAGVDLTLDPAQLVTGLPAELLALLQKPLLKQYDIHLSYLPPMDLCRARDRPKRPHRGATVAWTMWERLPLTEKALLDDYGAPPPLDGHKWFERYDLMMVPNSMNIDAFHHLNPELPMMVQPTGVDLESFPYFDRPAITPDRPMHFAMLGQLTGRKNPFAALEAWKLLFQRWPDCPARLTLKTSAIGLHPKITDDMKNCQIITAAWQYDEIKMFYRDVDVLVSTSRGEGLNKPALEAQATGATCIATDWSGHRTWLFPQANYALGGELVPAGQDRGAVQFEADVEQLADLMMHCVKNPEEVRQKGRVAAKWVADGFSWGHIAESLERTFTGLLVKQGWHGHE